MTYFTAYGSHLLIDLCTGRTLGWTNTGAGIPLLWPWPKNFSSPLVLIPGVRHGTLRAIFRMDNAWSSIYEPLIFGAITVIVFVLWKQKLKSRTLGKRKLKSRANRPTSEVSEQLLTELQHQK